MGKTVGLVIFPGSNCDQDCRRVLTDYYQVEVVSIWHTESELPSKVDGLVLPGGFSYGDYLRGGALAAHSPVAGIINDFHRHGGPIIGICNGFQILCELGLLPGTLLANQSREFICGYSNLTVMAGPSAYQQELAGKDLLLPVAHGQGRYYLPETELSRLLDDDLVFAKYTPPKGQSGLQHYNPNGSVGDIAGVTNKEGNILGLMPHPERVVSPYLGGDDGLKVWDIFLG